MDKAMQEMCEMWSEDFRSKLPSRFKDVSLGNFEATDKATKAALAAVTDWCATVTLSGPGMFLTGPVGAGKTHLAIAAVRHLVETRGWYARYLPVQKYLEERKESFNGNGKASSPRKLVETYKVIILDDIGVERPTPWVQEQLFALIDAAYNAGVLVVVTSNLDYAELAKPETLGERAVSRLVDMTDKFLVNAHDYRAKRNNGRKK